MQEMQEDQQPAVPQRPPPNTRRDTVRRDCPHPGRPHTHGTRAAYISDRCGCTRCRAANRATEEHRTAAIAVGRWQPFADAQQVRHHLELLRRQGLGTERIAILAGVSISTVRRLLATTTVQGTPTRRIRTATAARLLALPTTTARSSPRRLVPAGVTHERLHHLMSAGHPLAQLAAALGRTPNSLRRSLSRCSVTAQTDAAVEELYNAMVLGAAPSTEHPPSPMPTRNLPRRASHSAVPVAVTAIGHAQWGSCDGPMIGKSKTVIAPRRVVRLLLSTPA